MVWINIIFKVNKNKNHAYSFVCGSFYFCQHGGWNSCGEKCSGWVGSQVQNRFLRHGEEDEKWMRRSSGNNKQPSRRSREAAPKNSIGSEIGEQILEK